MSKHLSNSKEKELKFDHLIDNKHINGINMICDSNIEQTEKSSLLPLTTNAKNEKKWSVASDQLNCSNEDIKLN